MTREVTDTNILKECTLNFCKVLEQFSQYCVVSGFVAIASGRTRGTENIDVLIER